MDLDFWECFGRKKNQLCLIAEEIRYWCKFHVILILDANAQADRYTVKAIGISISMIFLKIILWLHTFLEFNGTRWIAAQKDGLFDWES